jgi:hypothetical protein
MDIIGRLVSELSGCAAAMPTPLENNGNVDSAPFAQFCYRQTHQGATAPCDKADHATRPRTAQVMLVIGAVAIAALARVFGAVDVAPWLG